MYSKLLKAALLAGSLALSACVPVGEEPPPTPDVSTGLKLNMECFADTVKTLDAFVKGSASDFQLHEFWNCNSNAISEFEKNTHGRFEDRFTSRELANFVERYFLKDNTKISNELLRQIFLLKRIFVGGGIDSITRQEMFKAIEVMKELKQISLRLNPHMKVYSFNWKTEGLETTQALTTFAAAETAIQAESLKIAPLMVEDYDLNELIGLAREIDEFGKGSNKTDFSKLANQMVPVLVATKNIVFKQTGSRVNEWGEFLTLMTQFYSRYGYFDYFVKSADVMGGEGLLALNSLVSDSLRFLDTILDRKVLNGHIPLSDISKLWTAVLKAGLLPKKVTVPSLDLVTAALINKVFVSPDRRITGASPLGLGKDNINEVRREFSIWFETQLWLDSQFKNLPPGVGISHDDMYAAVKAATQTQGMAELLLLVQTPESLSFDSKNHLFLGTHKLAHTKKAVNLLNVARSAVRTGMRGYAAKDRATKLTGLTQAEAESLFLDVRPLVVELDLIDPKDAKFAGDRFRDANLFTPFANGNDMLSFAEGADLFLMLASGIKLDALYKEVLEKQCALDNRPAFKGDWLVDVSCAIAVYKNTLAGLSINLPEFLKYLGSLTSKQYDEVVFGLMRGAGYVGEKDGKVRLATLGQFPQVTQYVEQVYHRFDTNHDGIFSTDEALLAYPIFRSIITKFSNLKTDKENQAVFGYMLKFGHAPVTIIDKGWFALVWVNKDPAKDWDLSADRQKVIEILAFISEATAKAKPIR